MKINRPLWNTIEHIRRTFSIKHRKPSWFSCSYFFAYNFVNIFELFVNGDKLVYQNCLLLPRTIKSWRNLYSLSIIAFFPLRQSSPYPRENNKESRFTDCFVEVFKLVPHEFVAITVYRFRYNLASWFDTGRCSPACNEQNMMLDNTWNSSGSRFQNHKQ